MNVLWTGPKDGSLNGQTVTVAVNADTKIVNGKDHSAAQLSDIQPGDLVGAARGLAGCDAHVADRAAHPRLVQLPLDRRHDQRGRHE